MEVLPSPALSALRSTFDQGVKNALTSVMEEIALTAATSIEAPGAECVEITVEVSKKCLWSTVMHHRSDSTTFIP